MVASIGARYFSSRDVAVEQLPEKIGNIDLVYEATGASAIAFRTIEGDLTVFQQRWPVGVRALVTGRYAVEAYRDVLVGPAQGIKNVIAFA